MDARWPLAVNRIRRGLESHTFGMVRRHPDGTPKPHQGWDFEAPPGTPCYAVLPCIVAGIRDHGDYGRQVLVEFARPHPSGARYAFYAHLDTVAVEPGFVLEAGDAIGTTGRTGNAATLPAADDHLHFEARTTAWPGPGLRARLSPLVLFGACPLREAVTVG